MATFAGSQQYDVTSVSFGIEAATGAGGTQPVTVRLYDHEFPRWVPWFADPDCHDHCPCAGQRLWDGPERAFGGHGACRDFPTGDGSLYAGFP